MVELNWADWTLVGIIVFSSLISVMRGFAKEALSLVIWLVAFVIARRFHPHAETLLSSHVADPQMLTLAAFLTLFILTLLVGAIISYLVSMLIKITGLSAFDRVLGVVFGAARGVVVCVVIVALVRYTPWANSVWWADSEVIKQLTVIEFWTRSVLSASIGNAAMVLAEI